MKNIVESFISIQGEGLRTGRPSLFVRVSGCNLRCIFRNDKDKVVGCCDTPYASFEGSATQHKYTDEDVVNMLIDNFQINDVVITGGEPMLNQTELEQFIMLLRSKRSDIVITIETNGTFEPNDRLLKMVDLWSVSPKLAPSEPRIEDAKKYNINEAQCNYHRDHRINIKALSTIIEKGNDCQLKFVYTGPNSIEEISNIVDQVQLNTSFNVNDYVMLMPEGVTKKAILDKSDEVVNICIERGWTYSSRMHILIWGNVKEK